MEKEKPVNRLMNIFITMLLLACAGTALAGTDLMRNAPGSSLDEICTAGDQLNLIPGADPVYFSSVVSANNCFRRDRKDYILKLNMNGSGLISMSFVQNIGTIHIMTECCGGEELATSRPRYPLECIWLGQGSYYAVFEIDSEDRAFEIKFQFCEDPCLAASMALTEGESSEGDQLRWVHTTNAASPEPYYGGYGESASPCRDESVDPTGNRYGFDYYSWYNQDFDWKHENGFYGEAQSQYCLEGDFQIDSAFVVICAYDVDFCTQTPAAGSSRCELDLVKVNNNEVYPYYLEGIDGGPANRSLTVTWFQVPVGLLNATGNDLVNVDLDIDANSDICTWATTVEWSKLVVYASCRQIPNPELYDLGDLRYNNHSECAYHTYSLANGGPANALDYDIAWLGTGVNGSKDVDPESEPKINDLETTDNGVEFVLNQYEGWTPCSEVCVNVTVTTGDGYEGQPLYLWAWKDGNMDCDFDDDLCDVNTINDIGNAYVPDECIIHGQPVIPGVNSICFTDPGVTNEGVYNGYFRFRLMSMGEDILNCTTAQYEIDYTLGETEDYIVEDLQLAVELLGFNAESENSKIRLLWNTASESENDHFELNRRMVGDNWQNLSVRIEGAGTTTIGGTYGYIDTDVTVGRTYRYQLIAVDESGIRTVAAETEATVIAGAVVVDEFKLHANFPNPFNPSTTISYDLKEAASVQLSVFDVLGRQVATLVNAYQNAGRYSVNFEAGAMPSGVYFYRLETPEFSDMKKMMLLK
jgi:hypothetical protein